MLRCGLYAVNAVLAVDRRYTPATAAEMDDICQRLHDLERAVHAEGTDLKPHPEGNYPVEVLMQCLARRGLHAEYARAQRRVPTDRGTIGSILATGDHYVAVVRPLLTEGGRGSTGNRIVR